MDGTYSLFNHRHDTVKEENARTEAEVDVLQEDLPETPERFTSEAVAYYPNEKNGLPYDVEIQVLHNGEPEPQKDEAVPEPQTEEPSVLTPPRKKNPITLAKPLAADGHNYHMKRYSVANFAHRMRTDLAW